MPASFETPTTEDPLAEYPNIKVKLLKANNGKAIRPSDIEGSAIIISTEKVIGKGDFTVVFQSTLADSGEATALKVHFPKPSFNQIPETTLKHNLESEAKLLRGSRHPYLPKYYGFLELERGKTPALAREYLPETIKVPLDIPEVVKVVEQIGSAAKYLLQDRNALVTDLNPDQIARRANGGYVLFDLNATTASPYVGMDRIFTAPEVKAAFYTKEPINKDMRTIIFSLGMTAYALLGGHLPSAEDLLPGSRWKLQSIPDVQEEVIEVLRQATELEPENRQSDIDKLTQQLKDAVK